MAKIPRASTRSRVTPASAGTSAHDLIDAALNRLLCEVALGEPEGGLDDTASGVAELAALVRGTVSPVLDRALDGVEASTDAAQLALALTVFGTIWNQPAPNGDDMASSDEVAAAAVPATAGVPAAAAAPASSSAATAGSRVEEDVAALAGDAELATMFTGEALDHLSTIESVVLQLEAAPGDSKLLNDVFRPFHTVKGNAGALGVTRVQELAHKVENLLDLCRSGRHTLGPAETDAVLEAVDVLTALIHDLQARLAGQPGTDLEPRRQALMLVVDALVSGALVPTPAAVPASAQPASARSHDATPGPGPAEDAPAGAAPAEAAPAVTPTRRADDGPGQASVKVDTRKLDNLVDMVGELVIAQSILQEDPALTGTIDERLSRNLAHLKRITSDLQRTAMSMRLVPIRQTFQKMARLVRDLSRKSGKQVELVLAGEDTELDRRVVEDINDPLMHMVRNSMDHGVEDGARRAKAGKHPEGRLALSAYHQGGSIVIAIQDDGAGLNTDKILAKAISQGLVPADATLTPSEIHQLIFQPGFSTADQVTEISGRGVGMDVVRRNIDALRGRIEIQSVPGQGTTFLIKLPLTLAILDGLILGVGNQRFVMPTFSVRESLRPLPDQVHTVMGRPAMIQVRGRLVPLLRLAEFCRVEAREHDVTRSTVVVIEDDGRRVGLVVDELLGKQEVVIKSLGESFGQMAGVAGGAILGDGRVGLILDAHGIVGASHHDQARVA